MSKKVIKPRFYSAYDRENPRASCSGSCEAPVFSDSFDDNGVATVIVTGTTNLDDYIQSFKDDTDIYKILDRLTLAGAELPVVPLEQFGDVSGMPTNIHEALKQISYARGIFNGLSDDKRKAYNNNFNEFISDFGSSKFLSLFMQEKSNNKVEEVVSDVNAE